MAEKETEEDLDLDVDKAGKSKTNMLLIILIVVILLVGGGVAAVFLLSGDDSDSETASDAQKSEEATPVAAAHVIYSALRPTFVINFEDTAKARYVQLDLTVMAHEQHAIDLVQEHSPVIRNNIITILSGQKYEVLNTNAGKQKLRADLLESINKTIADEVSNTAAAEPPAEGEHDAKSEDGNAESDPHAESAPSDEEHAYIQAVYFTSLVMQ